MIWRCPVCLSLEFLSKLFYFQKTNLLALSWCLINQLIHFYFGRLVFFQISHKILDKIYRTTNVKFIRLFAWFSTICMSLIGIGFRCRIYRLEQHATFSWFCPITLFDRSLSLKLELSLHIRFHQYSNNHQECRILLN